VLILWTKPRIEDLFSIYSINIEGNTIHSMAGISEALQSS